MPDEFPADSYLKFQKKMPGATYVIQPSIKMCFDDGKLAVGKRVFDAGCGRGFHTKRFLEWAKEYLPKTPNVHLEVQSIVDLKIPSDIEKFDVVTSIFVLHFINKREDLRKAIHNLSCLLKSGGTLIACFPNFEAGFEWPRDEALKFGIGMSFDESAGFKDGLAAKINIYQGNEIKVSMGAYLWLRSTYQEFLEEAGFEKINFLSPIVSEEGKNEFGAEFFHNLLNPPKDIFVKAVKK
ncbi:unnamed protein product, partial [Mesorhabditis belari]|uniref:Methyltransferase type 11 domain-containing protein n=1 Tax=Mesorhabditis belari TaxID=2138241 RepID=A0AAF3FBR4_9BILA